MKLQNIALTVRLIALDGMIPLRYTKDNDLRAAIKLKIKQLNCVERKIKRRQKAKEKTGNAN